MNPKSIPELSHEHKLPENRIIEILLINNHKILDDFNFRISNDIFIRYLHNYKLSNNLNKPKDILIFEEHYNIKLFDRKFDTNSKTTDFFVTNSENEVIEIYVCEKNISSMFDFSIFPKLERLTLDGNKITKITGINKLRNLLYLNLGYNEIEKIEGLDDVRKLEKLILSGNRIAKIEGIDNLICLLAIDLWGNFITKIEGIEKLRKLKILDLGNNEITKLNTKFNKSLKKLNLFENKITEVSEDLLLEFPIIMDSDFHETSEDGVNLEGNPLDDSLLEILLLDNRKIQVREIKHYYERIRIGSVKVKRVKLILIGNTGVGKTTLSKLICNDMKPRSGSTHGLNLFRYHLDDIEVLGYDFGGQDYYHNSYQAFFDKKAIYLHVWGNNQKDEYGINKSFEHIFPLKYWLGSLNKVAIKKNIIDLFENQFQTILQDYSENRKLINSKLWEIFMPNSELDKNIDLIEEFKKFNKENSILENLTYYKQNEELKKILNQNELNLKFEYLRNVFKNDANDLDLESLKLDKVLNHINSKEYTFKYFLLQNINENSLKEYLNEKELAEEYDFISGFKSFNFKEDLNKWQIKNWLLPIIHEFVEEKTIPKIDDIVFRAFQTDLIQNKVIISFDDIRNIDSEISKFDDEKIVSLINSLSGIWACKFVDFSINLINKFPASSLEKKVIVNLGKFTKWQFEILNKRDLLEKKGGYFNHDDAKKWLSKNNISSENVDYLIAFMIHNKLIFNIDKNERSYFAPGYLKTEISKLEQLFLNKFSVPIIKYSFSGFFHTSLLSNIIDKFFNNLVKSESKSENVEYILWRNKVVLFDNSLTSNTDSYFLIELNHGNGEIHPNLTIRHFSQDYNQLFLINLMEFIEGVIENYEKHILAKNGHYIPFKLLSINNYSSVENKEINYFEYGNIHYRKSDFKQFLNDTQKKNFPMKKVFISYSHEDFNEKKELLKYLKPLERDGKIELWHDLMLESGLEVTNTIIEKLEESDIVILLITQDFINSEFIYGNELPTALRKKISGRGEIVPIYLKESTIFDLNLEISADEKMQTGNSNQVKMGNYYFIPQDDKNNLKAVNTWEFKEQAWKKIYEDIKRKVEIV